MNKSAQTQHEIGCPSRDDLQALLGGSLDEIKEQSIESHVATCELCGQTLEELCQNDAAKRWQALAGQEGASFTHVTSPKRAAAFDSPGMPASTPEIDGFEILDVAGRGGMGIVYKARQRSLKRDVAIKMLHSAAPDDVQRLQRFKNEADSIASIQHPNVISIYEIAQQNGTPYIVLEYIHGPNLAQLIKNSAPFDNFSAAQLVKKLALAVDAAHQSNLIHRDLKPANILMQLPEGSELRDIRLSDGEPKITDFGLAKSFEYDNKTQTSMLVGTPTYMAPEQITCPDDWAKPPVDVYALGVILYEMLTGRVPFASKSMFELFKKIENEAPQPVRISNRGAAKDLEAITLKCLEKSPEARYQTAKELANDLERYLRREPVIARKATVFKRLRKWAQRNKMTVALASLSLVALIFLFSLLRNISNQRQSAIDDYQSSFQKATLLFADAQESELGNFESWENAQDEIARAIEIQQEYPQLIDADDAHNLSNNIEFHRSARQFIVEIDSLLLGKVLDYFLPLESADFRDGVASSCSFLESVDSENGGHPAKQLQSLDDTTLEGVIASIYRILLHDTGNPKFQEYEQVVTELDNSEWRKSAYQVIKSKQVKQATQLIEQPDRGLSPNSQADFLAGLHLDGAISYQQIAEALKQEQLTNRTSFWLNYQLFWFTRRYQHPSNAIPFLRAAMAQRDTPALRLQLGHLFREIREFDQARREFFAVLDQDPENTVVYRLLAGCYRSEKKYDKAIENFKLAIRLEPSRKFIRGDLLSTYLAAGQKKAALEFANELLQRESVDHETFYSKAIAYTKLGKLDLAIQNYERAIDADPSNLKCLMDLANVYVKQGKLDEARQALEELIKARPNILTSLKLMMNICIAQKDYESAEKFARRRLSLSPMAPGYISDLADIYVKSGKFDLAEEAYLKSQSLIRQDDDDNIDKDNVYALEQLAILYNNRNKLDFAEATARRAIRIRPHAEQANFLLVQILCKLDRIDEALDAAFAYKENAPNSLYAQTSILNTLMLMKRYDEAIATFEQGQAMESGSSKIFTDAKLEQLKKQAAENREPPED